MFYQTFLSTQVRRKAILSNKHGICELPDELPNSLRLSILGKQERSGKYQNLVEL